MVSKVRVCDRVEMLILEGGYSLRGINDANGCTMYHIFIDFENIIYCFLLACNLLNKNMNYI